tara:strand:+ start:10727 stop:11464 length:738 start_codon:yes stop_codon:yes gene_type:complete
MIIEHFGLPLSGKTSAKKKNLYKYENFLSYRRNYILHLYQKKKIKFFTFKLLNTLCEFSENKKNSLLDSYLKKLIFSLFEKILFQKLYFYCLKDFSELDRKYNRLNIELEKVNKKNKKYRRKKISLWFKEFILYRHIAIKNNNDIFDDEGIFQRILSLIFEIKKINKKQILTILKLLPKPDVLYFVNISQSNFRNKIKFIKDKNQKLFFSQNYKNIYTNHLIVKKLIREKIKGIKTDNIYIDKDY